MRNAKQIFASSFTGILQIKMIKADELLFKKGTLIAQQKRMSLVLERKKKNPDMNHKYI